MENSRDNHLHKHDDSDNDNDMDGDIDATINNPAPSTQVFASFTFNSCFFFFEIYLIHVLVFNFPVFSLCLST